MKKLISFIIVSFPLFASAQGLISTTLSGEQVFQNVVKYVFNPVLQIATVVAFLYFLFGVMMFIWNKTKGGEGDDINNGKRHLVFGLLGLFIVFSINGILAILNNAVGGLFQ